MSEGKNGLKRVVVGTNEKLTHTRQSQIKRESKEYRVKNNSPYPCKKQHLDLFPTILQSWFFHLGTQLVDVGYFFKEKEIGKL